MHLPDHSQFSVALQQPRRQPASTPALFAAWRAVWREAPANARLDLLRLALMTPAMLIVFTLLWGMTPA
jgi:hypothetical protein